MITSVCEHSNLAPKYSSHCARKLYIDSAICESHDGSYIHLGSIISFADSDLPAEDD